MARLTNYTASVEIQSGMKPKNNQDFPLMEAHDIVVDENGTRLDEAIGTIRVFDVTSEQWVARTPRVERKYVYRITAEQHGLTNPYIDSVMVIKDDGSKEKTILYATRNVNDGFSIYSDIKINCKIVIKGE